MTVWNKQRGRRKKKNEKPTRRNEKACGAHCSYN
jgi:hypothetical protein